MYRYNSLEAFLKAIDTAPKFGAVDYRKSPYFSKSFEGVDTYEQAVNIAKHGDSKIYSKLVEATSLNDKTTPKHTMGRSKAGAVVCMPAYLAGDERNMLRTRKVPAPVKRETVYIDVSVPGIMPTDDIIKSAGRILSWLNAKEKAGIRLTVYIGRSGADRFQQPLDKYIVYKRESQRLNLRLLSGLLHPSFLRVLMFQHQVVYCDSAQCWPLKSSVEMGWLPSMRPPFLKPDETYVAINENVSSDDIVTH